MIKSLSQIQHENALWVDKNFPGAKTYQPLLGAVEELGELAHAHLKEEQGIRTSEDHVANAKDAIGDTIIYLINYCNLRGFDIAEIVSGTWEGVQARDWTKNKDIPKDTKFKEGLE